jgi:hypothetical protein
MIDELLTTFRAEVPPPGEATARRAYEHAVRSRRKRVTGRRPAVAAVVVAAAVAGGLYASLGGASSNVNPQRQRIVDEALTQVQQAFGGQRLIKATLDGSLLTVDVRTDEPVNGVVGPLEADMVAHVADDRLRAAGEEGIKTVGGPGLGEMGLYAYPDVAQLPDGACDIPPGTTFANVTAASGRLIPLLGGFCAIHFTTSDPKAFAGGVNETLNQLWRTVPASPHDRAVLVEADDEKGVPVIVAAWEPMSGVGGGAVYVRPDLECYSSMFTQLPVGRCSSDPGNG